MENLKILVTIVNRDLTNKYLKNYEEFDVVFQTTLLGRGTADKEIIGLLGLGSEERSIIFSFAKETKINDLLNSARENITNDGGGIAFTIPLSSMIGRNLYMFLIKKIDRKGAHHARRIWINNLCCKCGI